MEITYHGITRSSNEWAKLVGVTESTLRYRIHHWGLERALQLPKQRPGTAMGRRTFQRLSRADRNSIVTLYMDGNSEDAIAERIGKNRRYVSERLIKWGLKRKGIARERLAGFDYNKGVA